MSRQYHMCAGNSGVMCLLGGHLIPIINNKSRQYLMHAGNSGVMCLLCGHLIPIINNKSRQYLMRAGNSGVMCLLCGHLILITIRVVSIKCILAIQRIICHMLAFNPSNSLRLSYPQEPPISMRLGYSFIM